MPPRTPETPSAAWATRWTQADDAGQALDDAAITTSIKGKYLDDDTLKGLDISVDTVQGS